MYITYSELFKLKEMREYKVVSGEGGLDRIIRWNHVVEIPDFFSCLNSGEIVFISGVALNDVKEDLLKIVQELYNRNAAGLVVQIGRFIKDIPVEVVELSNKLSVPIIVIPFENKIVDITYAISKKIFDNYHEDKSMAELLKEVICLEYRKEMEEKAIFYGYNPELHYISVVIVIENINEYIKENKLYSQKEVDDLQNSVLNIIRKEFSKKRIEILYTLELNGYVLMIPIKDLENMRDDVVNIINDIKERIINEKPGTIVNSGIGHSFDKLIDFKRSTIEAKMALKMLKVCDRKNDIRVYDEIGIYRLFFKLKDSGELESLLEGTLGKLIDYDKCYESDLVNTLDGYLANNCNIGKASEALFIHRNTLKYRINRIEEILQCSLQEVNVCFDLRLAYKLKKFLINETKYIL